MPPIPSGNILVPNHLPTTSVQYQTVELPGLEKMLPEDNPGSKGTSF